MVTRDTALGKSEWSVSIYCMRTEGYVGGRDSLIVQVEQQYTVACIVAFEACLRTVHDKPGSFTRVRKG